MTSITFEETRQFKFSFKTTKKMQASRVVNVKTVSSLLRPSRSTLKAISEAEKYKQSGKIKFTSDINELMKNLE